MKPDIIHIAALEAKDARIKELEEVLKKALSALKYHTGKYTIYTQRACEVALRKETV